MKPIVVSFLLLLLQHNTKCKPRDRERSDKNNKKKKQEIPNPTQQNKRIGGRGIDFNFVIQCDYRYFRIEIKKNRGQNSLNLSLLFRSNQSQSKKQNEQN